MVEVIEVFDNFALVATLIAVCVSLIVFGSFAVFKHYGENKCISVFIILSSFSILVVSTSIGYNKNQQEDDYDESLQTLKNNMGTLIRLQQITATH